VKRSGAEHPLVIGDRLDTDIAGATRAGLPSMLVMTGVSDLLATLTAPTEQRPTFVAPDLRGLNQTHPPAQDGRCGDAYAEYDADARRIVLRQAGTDAESLCAVVTAGWHATDSECPVDGVDAG
jgi:hypothetical protein